MRAVSEPRSRVSCGLSGLRVPRAGSKIRACCDLPAVWCCRTKELQGSDVGADPVRQRLARQRFGVCVVARTQDRDEELGSRDFAGRPIDDRDRVAREVEEELLAGAVLLAQDDVKTVGVCPIALGKPGVAEAIGAALAVFGPLCRARGYADSAPPTSSGGPAARGIIRVQEGEQGSGAGSARAGCAVGPCAPGPVL